MQYITRVSLDTESRCILGVTAAAAAVHCRPLMYALPQYVCVRAINESFIDNLCTFTLLARPTGSLLACFIGGMRCYLTGAATSGRRANACTATADETWLGIGWTRPAGRPVVSPMQRGCSSGSSKYRLVVTAHTTQAVESHSHEQPAIDRQTKRETDVQRCYEWISRKMRPNEQSSSAFAVVFSNELT